MTDSTRRPSSIAGVKRIAKAIKRERGISYTEALDVVARHAGFENFTHARRMLETGELAPAENFPRRPGGGVDADKFLEQCTAVWVQTLDLLNPGKKDRVIWSGLAAIMGVLDRVLAHTRSHAHLPTGGGLDYVTVRPSTEAGSLELVVDRGRSDIVRPAKLILESVAAQPAESFLMLELANLAPSSAYVRRDDPDDPNDDWLRRSEEVLELSPGKYAERGGEHEARESARILVRWFNGKILFVTKGSMWNSTPGTYDGEHDRLSADDIRAIIERSLED